MKKSVAPFVMGLIGGILGIIGGLCLSVCAEAVDALGDLAGESSNLAVWVWVCGVGGSALGLVGSTLSLSKDKIGGFLMLVGAAAIIVMFVMIDNISYIMIATVILFVIAGLIDLAGGKKQQA